MKINREEYKLICKELTERVKDTVIAFPHKEDFEKLKENDSYTLTVTFVGADILQILGRIRRK